MAKLIAHDNGHIPRYLRFDARASMGGRVLILTKSIGKYLTIWSMSAAEANLFYYWLGESLKGRRMSWRKRVRSKAAESR